MIRPGHDVERVAREERAAVLAVVARQVRDLGLAEDAVQEALLAALTQWPRDGVPERPGAWLTVVARRAALAALRRAPHVVLDQEAVDRLEASAAADPAEEPAIPDERLELFFACCHPALALDAQVALTLRTVAGLTTGEIARAFLVDERALAQRLVRAQRKVRDSGIAFAVPPRAELPARLATVLRVIYLVFTEGHAAVTGDQRVRADLCEEAVGLARIVAILVPDEPEVLGLAALVLAHDARRAARLDRAGRSVPLELQDRSRYDGARSGEAAALLERAMALGRPGAYQLQAAIALLHAQAPTADATDWVQVAALYEALERITPSPVVRLNRAAAVGMADGPVAGLALLDALASGPLAEHHLLHATRADLLRRAGRAFEAAAALAYARDLAPEGGPARADLAQRLDEVAAAAPGSPAGGDTCKT